MLEIYTESLYDLLGAGSDAGGAGEGAATNPSGSSSTPKARRSRSSSGATSGNRPLKMHQDGGSFYVSDLKVFEAGSAAASLETIGRGLKATTTSATGMNLASSRGHTVVLLSPKAEGKR